MVNGLKVPSRLAVLNHRGTLERRRSGFVDWPSNCVGASRDRNASSAGQPNGQVFWSRQARKALWGAARCPYRKPTQVGEASSLR